MRASGNCGQGEQPEAHEPRVAQPHTQRRIVTGEAPQVFGPVPWHNPPKKRRAVLPPVDGEVSR